MSHSRKSQNKESSEGRLLQLRTEWEKEEVGFSGVLRMKWKIESIAKVGDITLLGYCIQFYHKNKLKGTYVDRRWTKSKRFVTNPHFTTLLWPGEIRTYEWANTSPAYYGMKKKGRWEYLLHVLYKYSIGGETREASGEKTPIWIMADDMQLDINKVENVLTHEFAYGTPILIKRDVEAGSLGEVDLVVHRQKTILVVKTCHLFGSEEAIMLRKQVKWVQAHYLTSSESVIGLLLCMEPIPENAWTQYEDLAFWQLRITQEGPYEINPIWVPDWFAQTYTRPP